MTFLRNGPQGVLWISPAEEAAAQAVSRPGNFTVGMKFQVVKPIVWTGFRWYVNYVGTMTWKLRAYNVTDGVTLVDKTSPPVSTGINVVLFDTPLAITDLTKVYTVSAYETTGSFYAGMSAAPCPMFSTTNSLSPHIYFIDNSMYTPGDAIGTPPNNSNPLSNSGSTDRMTIEPTYTF